MFQSGTNFQRKIFVEHQNLIEKKKKRIEKEEGTTVDALCYAPLTLSLLQSVVPYTTTKVFPGF